MVQIKKITLIFILLIIVYLEHAYSKTINPTNKTGKTKITVHQKPKAKQKPKIKENLKQKITEKLTIFLSASRQEQKTLQRGLIRIFKRHLNYLVKQKINLDEYKYTKIKTNDKNFYLNPLHISSLIGYINGTRTILNLNSNPNIKNHKLNTPMHYSINNKITTLLIENGAKLKEKNYLGNTPLHQASRYKNFNVAKTLITNNADINELNYTDRSALFLAIENNNFRICKLLITNGADINANQNSIKYTPLHLAVLMLNKKIVRFLIKKGADITLKDIYGYTPLDLLKQLEDLYLKK